MRLTDTQIDRADGVLLGTAAGDALGAGYEFGYPADDVVIDMIGGGPFDWAPGEWTDDTSMAVCVAQGLASGGGLDAIAANFVAWYDTAPADTGNQTRAVLSRRSPTAAAMTEVASGLTGRTGGNGSLMRTAPVALAYLNNASALDAAAGDISALTHSDPRAGEACRLWSAAIRYAVLNGTYYGIEQFLTDAPEDVASFWRPLLDAAESGEPADFANNGWVVHALQTAWWAIATTPDTGPEQLPAALERCVYAGGDTDTTAAIAGGLLGARWGASAVPDAWQSIVHGYPGMGSGDLSRLTRRIIGGTA